jgi:hypothetical protein
MAKKSKKPSLALVDSETTIGIQPPFTLGKHGQSLWDRVQSEFDCSDAAGVELRRLVPPRTLPNACRRRSRTTAPWFAPVAECAVILPFAI